MGRHHKVSQVGLSAVELLITLLVAGLFLISGYSLYSFVIKDTGATRSSAKATSLANEYLEQNLTPSDTCSTSSSTPINNQPMAGLGNVTVTITIECPYGTDSSAKKVTSTVDYGNPQKTIKVSTNVGPDASGPDDYNIGWSFPTATPTTPFFYWNAISGADNYDLRWRINGGAWVTKLAETKTNYDLSLSGFGAYRNDVVNFQVTAKTGSTIISTSSTASATIPAWTSCPLQNGWLTYDDSWGDFAFTKTKEGVVFLNGLVKSGNTADYTTICTLPVGFRPTHAMLFRNHSNIGVSHIYILPDGRVQTISGGNGWYSVGNVSFLASGSTAANSLAALSLLNGWTRYDMSYDTLRSAVDGVGRVHVQGLVNPGTTTGGTPIANLPAAQQSNSRYYHIVVDNCGTGSGIYLLNQVFKSNGGACWHSSQFLYYPDNIGTWTNMTLQNGWVEYSAMYRPQYTKASDGVVTLRGLIKSGTTGYVTITNLPPGYRPLKKQLSVGYHANSGTMRVDVFPDGDVKISTGENTYNALDNISFVADQ